MGGILDLYRGGFYGSKLESFIAKYFGESMLIFLVTLTV